MQLQLEKGPSEFLEFSEVQRLPNERGWSAWVKVASGSFRCEGRRFYFSEPELFVATLKRASECLAGQAELRMPMEYEFIRLTLTELGHVQVQGFFCDYASSNELRFYFSLDQTYLSDFIRAWESALHEAAGGEAERHSA